jgi:hypothetical protein
LRPAAAIAFALGLLATTASPAFAAKTDVLVLKNGDRITGEVELLERGRLKFSTDDMGTLEVEWDEVASVTSAASFEIEDLKGGQYFGALQAAPKEGAVAIVERDGTRVLELLSVARISRLGASFWERLEGAVDVGASYTSSSDLYKLDLGAESRYQRPGYAFSANASATLSRQPEVEDTRRATLGVNASRRRPNRWLYFSQGLLEMNPQLGFNLRSSLAGGFGRYIVKSLHDEFLAGAGLSVNREDPLEGENTTNPEVLVVLQYGRFSYDFPKVDTQFTLSGYEGISDWERFRIELDARIRREVFKDFDVTLRGYESYDSRPATLDAANNDFGLSFALSWSY